MLKQAKHATSSRLQGYPHRLKTLMHEEVWQLDLSHLTRFKRFVYTQLRVLYIVGNTFLEDRITLQASGLTFTMLLSIAPFLAVAFSLLKAFGIHNRLKPLLAGFLAPLGPNANEITTRLLTFVDNVDVGALGAVGLLTLFITVLSLMGNIEHAFNRIWRVKMPRTLSRRFSDYLSVLLVGPVLVFVGLGIIASLQSSTLVQALIAIEPFGAMIFSILRLVPYFVLWGAFTFMYVFMPNTLVKLASAVLGGLVAAILWVSAGWTFAAFVATSTKYYAIYSSFAILLLFLFWFYVGWVVVLLGAVVAFAHQHLNEYHGERRAHLASMAERERLVLYSMTLIGQHFYQKKPPWTAEGLARRLRAPIPLVRELLRILADRRLVVAASNGEGYVPACDLEKIGIKEILDTLRQEGETHAMPGKSDKTDAVHEVIEEMDRAVATTLKDKSLKTLVLSQNLPDSASE